MVQGQLTSTQYLVIAFTEQRRPSRKCLEAYFIFAPRVRQDCVRWLLLQREVFDLASLRVNEAYCEMSIDSMKS